MSSCKPACNILERVCELILVKARHIQQAPGRKTDKADCAQVALAHRLPQVCRCLLERRCPYLDLGADSFERLHYDRSEALVRTKNGGVLHRLDHSAGLRHESPARKARQFSSRSPAPPASAPAPCTRRR